MSKTYSTRELAELAGVQPRTIRSYSFERILTKPEFRGKRTAYTEENLAEVLAFRVLMSEAMFSWQAKAAMKKMTPAELREKAGLVAAPPAPPAPPTASPAAAPPPAAKPASPDPPVALGVLDESWSRVALLPGLELHVRGDAKDFVRRVAQEIRAKYSSA